MFSICSSSLRLLSPYCRHIKPKFWMLIPPQPKTSLISSSSYKNDDSGSSPKPIQTEYDPSGDFLGLEVDIQPRNVISGTPQQKSWFGPNGQYIRELPCPSCRGRGYTPCTECDVERSRLDCSQCNGKGIRTCQKCHGECVIWEEAIDERPWERARSISPLKVKEDDDVDNLDIKLNERRKSKRVYQAPSPEVGLKISRSLKSLNAKTGLFSKHMKILHRDPKLHAQRVAAIKKAKGSDEARKHASEAMKAFFRNPENRLKRSLSMKGVKFYCSNCGREGHRRNNCPELVKNSSVDRRFKCRVCGQRGHNRRTCQKARSSEAKRKVATSHHCRICGQTGHNCRTCPKGTVINPNHALKKGSLASQGRSYTCGLCQGKGHNIRTCSAGKKQ